MMLRLKAWLQCETGVRHKLNGACSIGRLTENQIVIDDSRVSRRHALLFPQAGVGYWLLDFGSSNGTQLNGYNLLKPTLLQNLDRISVGGRNFSFWHSMTNPATGSDAAAGSQSAV